MLFKCLMVEHWRNLLCLLEHDITKSFPVIIYHGNGNIMNVGSHDCWIYTLDINQRQYMWTYSGTGARVCVCVCGCVCLCVCDCLFVCLCVFIPFHCKGFSWLSKTINIMAEVRPAMLCWGNISVSRTFVTKLRSRSASAQRQILANSTTPREVL